MGVGGVPVELYRIDAKQASSGSLKPATPSTANESPSSSGSATGTNTGKAAKDETAEGSDDESTADEAPAKEPPRDDTTIVHQPQVSNVPKNGTLVASTHTDNSGAFFFTGIEPGEYEVRLADDQGPLAEGFVITSGDNPRRISAFFKAARVEVGVFKAELTLVKAQCPEAIAADEQALCRMIYRNDNPVPLPTVLISVALPDTIDVTPQNNGEYLPNLHRVQWAFATIEPGQMIQVGFMIRPRPQVADTVALEFAWQFDTELLDDPIELNIASTNLTASAQVFIQFVGPETGAAGEPLSYEVLVKNTGDLKLSGTTLVITLPESITSVQLEEGAFDPTTHQLRFTLGTLVVGTTAARYFTMIAPTNVSKTQPLKLAASIEGEGVSAKAVQTTGFVTTVTPDVGLDFQVTTDPHSLIIDPDTEKDVFTWEIQLTQTGEAALHGTTVTATLDPNLILVTASDNGTFDGTARTVTWDLGAFASGASQTLTLQATPNEDLQALLNTLLVTITVNADELSEPLTKQSDVIAKHEVQ